MSRYRTRADIARDVRECRQHIRYLRANGMTLSGIATAAGVHIETVRRINLARGSNGYRSIRPMRATLDAILGVHLAVEPKRDRLAPVSIIEPLIADMRAWGYSEADLCRMLGWTTNQLRLGRYGRVQFRTVQRVRVLHELLRRRRESEAS